jgi:hypothetical protein
VVAKLRQLCAYALLVLSAVACDRLGQDPSFERTADAPKLIAAAQAETPLPPNSTFQPIKFNVRDSYEKGYFTHAVQWQAQCKWFMYWLKGFEARDQVILTEAAAMLKTIHTWIVYAGGHESYRTLIDSIEAKGELGDPTGIREYIRLNCREVSP